MEASQVGQVPPGPPRTPHPWPGSRMRRSAARGMKSLRSANQSLASIEIIGFVMICLLLLFSFVPFQQSGDGLILTVISLQKPTLYYWGADRYGVLLPWMTSWLRDPVENVHAQLLLATLAGLLAPVFFTSLLFRRSIDVWRAVLVTDGLLLLFGSMTILSHSFVFANPYGTSLTCAGLAALALRSSAHDNFGKLCMLLGAGLLVLAYIVNFGLVIIALPLVGLFALIFPSPTRMRSLSLHCVAACAGFLLPRIMAPDFLTPLDLHASAPNSLHYLHAVWSASRWRLVLAVATAPALIAISLIIKRKFRFLRLLLGIMSAMFLATALFFTLISSSQWLITNLFDMRYFIPGYFLLLSLGGASTWIGMRCLFRKGDELAAAFACIMVLLLLAASQRPDWNWVDNNDIPIPEEAALSREVASRYVAHALDGIAGGGRSDGYWDVWPAVFMTEAYHYETGYVGPNVFGVAYRGQARRMEFAARLAAQGHIRLACIDLPMAACGARAAQVMELTGLHVSEFAPTDTLPGGRHLGYIEIKA